MRYQAPGLVDDGEAVDRSQARTEVLAQAFVEAAGGYFDRLKTYEDNIAEAEDEMDRMRMLGAGSAIVGLLLVVLSFTVLADRGVNPVVLLVGVLVGAVGGWYAYSRYTEAEERIEANERNIEENEPDGEVTFVSQIGVPLYLIPYRGNHMIFDGLDAAQRTTLNLANIDGSELVARREQFDDLQGVFEEYLAGKGAVPPAFAEQLSPGVSEHRRLERPLIDQIDRITGVATDIDRETIGVNVHANNAKAGSVRALANRNLLRRDGDLDSVETRRSPAESEAVVDEIRGVEEEAVSGDVLELARETRERVKEVATAHASRLQTNSRTVDDHFDSYADAALTSVHKHVCAECLADELADIDEELGLVDEILSAKAGSLGAALSDSDLDRGTDEEFTRRIREDIEERIPELEGRLRESYTTLDDLGADGGYCDVHGGVDTRRIADSGALFGEVWRSLYYAFREPIMESAEDLERDAEEARQNKEQKLIDISQYEQIAERAQREYRSVKTDYEAAREIERQLG